MRRVRFSIASLLGLVLSVAVASAALREADELWDSGVFSLTLGLLLVSILLAIHRTGSRRAFWTGFALSGWVYLVTCSIPVFESKLPTSKGLAYLDSYRASREIVWTDDLLLKGVRSFENGNGVMPVPSEIFVFVDASSPSTRPATNYIKRLVAVPNGTPGDFVRIGHSLLALVMALCGGHLSRWLFNRERTQRAGEPGVPTVPAPDAGAA